MPNETVDVLLLCAVPVEWDALRVLIVDAVEDSLLSDPALKGRLIVGDRSLTAALVEVGVGTSQSGMATLKAVETYRPSLVVFAGVAGGIKDVELGDVVIADKVYYYEAGKLVEGEFHARSDTRVVPQHLDGLARKFRAGFEVEDFNLFVGALASGEKVVADSSAEELDRIRRQFGDALAVEMEGIAVLSAIDRADVGADFFIVRGVSDLVDAKGESDKAGWQETAAEHAKTVALGLVAAWDAIAGASIPEAHANQDLLTAGLPLPSASECYVVVAPPDSSLAAALVAGGLPLSMVLDLDPRSDADGLLSHSRADLETRRTVHLGSSVNPPAFGSSSTAWVSVRGFENAPSTVLEWTRTVRRQWRLMLSTFAASVGGKRVTILVIDEGSVEWDPWRAAVVDDLVTEFGDRAFVGIVGGGRSVTGEFRLSVPPQVLKDSLLSLAPSPELAARRMLPAAEGTVELSLQDSAWVSEDASIYWASDPDNVSSEAETLDFLRGGEISVAALDANADVTRAQTAQIEKQLLGMLSNRRTVRLNLFHGPGAGGTTLARRLGFNIRTRFLSRFRAGETIQRIEMVSRLTKNAVLVVVDSPAIREDQVLALTNELHAASLPVIVLAVSRRYSPPSAQSSSPYLADVLDDLEAADFVQTFAARSYAFRPALEGIATYRDHRRNAFFFGLVAFEEEFHGLESYVAGRLVGLEGPQREVMLVCSIAHYFGQSAVPEYALARLVGLPPGRAAGFARILAPELRGLLWRSPEGEWRTTHPLVAEEIMRQLGGGTVQWTQALSKWGRLFADFCLSGDSDDTLLLLIESVFIERGESSSVSSGSGRDEFARLIERIPSRDGASQLLTYVAERQGDHAHLWAHAARFQASRTLDFETAERYATIASGLAPDNPTLHHILGMVHRARVYDGIGRRVELDELAPWVHDAATEFAIARAKAESTTDYGFVSEIQMRVRVVEYGIRNSTLAEYLRGAPHELVVACVETAEDLISTMRYRGDPRNPSGFEQAERAKLTRIYGDFGSSLQLLDSLLKRGSVPIATVRRQLVWTYLARAGRDWRALSPKDVKRITSLLDENLTQEGYASSDALAWWRAIRLQQPPASHERIKEVLAYWRASNPCLEAEYCSFVACALDVLGGASRIAARGDQACPREFDHGAKRGNPQSVSRLAWAGRGGCGFGAPLRIGQVGSRSRFLGRYGSAPDSRGAHRRYSGPSGRLSRGGWNDRLLRASESGCHSGSARE